MVTLRAIAGRCDALIAKSHNYVILSEVKNLLCRMN